VVTSGISIVERLIDQGQSGFTPDVAKYFLSFDFSPEQHARYETLAAKAADGTLSDAEAGELDEFVAANALLTVLQSKARMATRPQTPAA
jgi:hypothetical protein